VERESFLPKRFFPGFVKIVRKSMEVTDLEKKYSKLKNFWTSEGLEKNLRRIQKYYALNSEAETIRFLINKEAWEIWKRTRK